MRAPPAVVVLALTLALLAGACVKRSTHQMLQVERNRLDAQRRELSERVRKLEASNESLSSERLELLDQIEDLRQERESLDAGVRKLRRSRAQLEASLQQREAQLATRTAELERVHGVYESLVADLEAEVATGQIQIEQLREGVRLNLASAVLFPSGSAKLSSAGEAILRRVAKQLREVSHRVEVQGHTDNLPIGGALAARYPTNWELAAARAARVIRLFEEEGVDPGRLSAVSFGEHRPLAANDTPEGLARNRRIEVRLIPVRTPGVSSGPSAASPAPSPSSPSP